MDIDFSRVEGMSWEPGTCPKGEGNKCAVKNVSICDHFAGIEYPDVVLCKFENKN
jgi:hypothetical protein